MSRFNGATFLQAISCSRLSLHRSLGLAIKVGSVTVSERGSNQWRCCSCLKNVSPSQTQKKTLMTGIPVFRPQLFVSDTQPLIDEVIDIKINDLEPNQKVTLRTEVLGGKMNTVFQAFGHYQANSSGAINLSVDSAMGGTYTGIEPMGLFWSLLPVSGQKPGARIFQRDSSLPVVSNLTVHTGFVDFDKDIKDIDKVKSEAKLIDAVTLERYYLSKKVKRFPVRDGRLRGSLFIPEGEGPFPGVIDMFGTAGGIAEPRAALLASHGFVTYALPFFAHDDLPKDLSNIEIEYFEEAVDWLLQHPMVKKQGIGMIGSSKGGELALLTASRKPEVKAVIGISTSHFNLHVPVFVNGIPTGYVSFNNENIDCIRAENEVSFVATAFLHKAIPSEAKNRSVIPVERIHGQILLIGGTDDWSVDFAYSVELTLNRLRKHGKEYLCKAIIFPGAGHIIEPPYSPLCKMSFVKYWKPLGMILGWGGSLESHARAQEQSWEDIITFLQSNIN